LPVRRNIPYSRGTFFITFTCVDWLPLIDWCDAYDLVYNWFDILKSKGHFINAYVIMPNHVHVLITFTETTSSINTLIGNGKRFMAYEIVKRLKKSNKNALLFKLRQSVEPSRKKNNKLHDIWKTSFDWKYCASNYFKYQKLNYIHANPCAGKWHLSSNPESYLHSSAGYYATEVHGIYPVEKVPLNV
jgi:REP element-mobilizing transposase RayT